MQDERDDHISAHLLGHSQKKLLHRQFSSAEGWLSYGPIPAA